MEYLVALAWGGATGSVLGACVRVGVAGGGVRGIGVREAGEGEFREAEGVVSAFFLGGRL